MEFKVKGSWVGYEDLEFMEILDGFLVEFEKDGKTLLATLNLLQWHFKEIEFFAVLLANG